MRSTSYWDNVIVDTVIFKQPKTTIKPFRDAAAVLELRNLVRAFPSGSSSAPELRRLVKEHLARVREALYMDVGGTLMERELVGAVAEKQRETYLGEWHILGCCYNVLETFKSVEA